MTSIKAIETRYAGCRFRSRLEARWAVFLDALSIPWEYEPQGFELPVNGRYLPDFWLPVAEAWMEIKGHRPSASEVAKITELGHAVSAQGQKARLLVGDIPRNLAMLPVPGQSPSFIIPEGCIGLRGTERAFTKFRNTRYELPDSYSFVSANDKVMLFRFPPGDAGLKPGRLLSGLEILGPGHELACTPQMQTVPGLPSYIVTAKVAFVAPTPGVLTPSVAEDGSITRTLKEQSQFSLEDWGVTPGIWLPGPDEEALRAALAAARSARFEHGQSGAPTPIS